MKKFLCVLLVTVMALSLLPAMSLANNDIAVTIDGVAVAFPGGQGPIIVDGRTLVPVRGVFEQLGFAPTWDGDTNQAVLTREDFTIVITIDSTTFTTNGTSYTLDVPAQNIGGRILVPIRHILESVGYELDWDSDIRTVVITTDNTQTQIETLFVPSEDHSEYAAQQLQEEPEYATEPEPVIEPTEPTPQPLTAGVDLNRTVWIAGTGGTIYHSVSNCGNMNPARATSMTRRDARARNARACLRCW